MTVILATSTTTPTHTYSKDDIQQVGARWLSATPHEQELFNRFVQSSQIAHRHFALPLETILNLSGPHERATHFEREGRKLLRETVSSLLSAASCNAHDVNHLIFTSCSVPAIPSIDVGLVDDLAFRRSVARIPIYQHGCAGGIIGLATAHRLIRPGQRAIVSAVELCSLVYQARDITGGNLVGSAIFGDGAAGVLVSYEGEGLRILDAQSFLVPESAHLMGYTIEDDGAHLRLDRALPQALARHAPPFITSVLKERGLTPQDVSWWLFHPGGMKVLVALEEAFSITRDRSRWAWEVMEQHGNMSSASILFVLESFMKSKVAKPGDSVCMVGVGPGLTIETIVLQQD